MGITEQAIFPEVNMSEAKFTHGMNLTIVIRNSTPEKSSELLHALGMPFAQADAA